MKTDPILALDNLVKDFAGKRAVDQISLKLSRGEIMGLLGPNGAGKTTTIRMIMNIIAPDSGRVEIFGQQFSEAHKNRIGYLPEERGLYRKLKVSETLQFFGKLKGMDAKNIESRGLELLKEFSLEDYYHKKVEELSKGMAQKLQFITTIIHSPELLILDEPFTGLDPINIELVKDIILRKKREGITIIFSTHLMEYAEKIVDSLVMINQGKKVIDGRLPDIKSSFGSRFIKVRYEGNPDFIGNLKFVKAWRNFGKEMEIELSNINKKGELLRMLAAKLAIESFQVASPSLNNIFMHHVGEKKTGA